MSDHDTIAGLVPLVALGALEAREEHCVVWHARSCAHCGPELAQYKWVTAALTPDGPPPPHLWDRIVAETETVAADTAPPAIQPERLRWRSRPRLSRTTAIAAVAAMVFAGLAAGVWMRGSTEDPAVVATQAAGEPGSYVGDFFVDGESIASIVLTSEGRGFVVPGDGLEPLTSDRTYQLWVITPDEQVISGGVLGNEPSVAAFTWSGPVSGFALTQEVAGGVVESEGDLVALATER